ncbi:MAG: class I SAM-dependent methyltransferase [Desulfotomaculaceae bacterium]|nr:class I SAM-dependent methyltransferase [Desulfotomaculaceae bacterium]
MFNLNDLIKADCCPAPYAPGEELWNDPHISRKMLEYHLSPDTNAASYKPEKIRSICEYLPQAMQLNKGGSIVDLGCGPGLYCSLLERKGLIATGIDRSENSIRYAKERNQGKKASFIQTNYLRPFGFEQFDAAIMISQDYGVLSPENRKVLLKNIYNALRPKGCFAFDVPSLTAFENRRKSAAPKWYASGPGFWRPHPHFVLEKSFFYPDLPALCDLFAVFDSEIKIYRIYQSFFSPEAIRTELEDGGFKVKNILSNLYGEKYIADSPLIGVICTKA